MEPGQVGGVPSDELGMGGQEESTLAGAASIPEPGQKWKVVRSPLSPSRRVIRREQGQPGEHDVSETPTSTIRA